MKKFALIGVCGFVAPRHLKAIRETGNLLSVCMDISDSAGVLDHYFPNADFFTNAEVFSAELQRNAKSSALDYLSICTPNQWHEDHIRLGLVNGLDVICEKPLVIHADRLLKLSEAEVSSGRKVFNLLQLRLHPQILALKQLTAAKKPDTKADVILTYVTSRGKWYHQSWKGKEEESGGIATNIGIHFFDMLNWIFGDVQCCEVHLYNPEQAAGFLELERARVQWFLSIRHQDLPFEAKSRNQYNYRSIQVDGQPLEFTGGFEDLHTQAYRAILAGQGIPLLGALPSVLLTEKIRAGTISKNKTNIHPAILPLL